MVRMVAEAILDLPVKFSPSSLSIYRRVEVGDFADFKSHSALDLVTKRLRENYSRFQIAANSGA